MKLATLLSAAFAISAQAATTVNWLGTWNIDTTSLKPVNGGDCCAPASLTVVAGAAGAPNHVTGSLDLSKPACGSATLNSNFNVQVTPDTTNSGNLVFTVGDANPLTFTLTQSTDGKTLTVDEKQGLVECKGTGAAVPAQSWDGAYALTAATTNDAKCCLPISNLEINKVSTGLTVQGEFDTTDACKTAGLWGVVFSGQIDTNTAGSATPTVTYNIYTDVDPKKSISVAATLSNANNVLTYTNTVNSVACAATLTRKGDAVGVQNTQWAGTWDIVKTAASSDVSGCCYAVSPLKFAANANNGYTISGTFENSAVCNAVQAGGKAFTVDVNNVDVLSSSINVALPIDSTTSTPFTGFYQGKTMNGEFSDPKCSALLTNQNYKAVPNFPAATINVTPTKDKGANILGVQIWMYVVLAIAAIMNA